MAVLTDGYILIFLLLPVINARYPCKSIGREFYIMKILKNIISLTLCTSLLCMTQFSFRNNISFAETQQYFGDADNDGVLTSNDALQILQFVTSYADFSDEQKKIADSDNDGNITSADALEVLRCVAGLSEPKIYESGSQNDSLSTENIYNAMIAFKEKYPEGTAWTNDNYYSWKGGIFSGGYGCAGFAFMLSDAAFGSLPARQYSDVSSDIKVGDILRINNNSHSVIVLEVNDTGVVIAEGNYKGTVHWGRTLTWSALKSSLDYIMTRYPE